MKLGVISGRNFEDKNRLFLEINELRKLYKIDTIVSGGSPGADTFGDNYADEYKLKKIIFKADWFDMSEPCFMKINAKNQQYNALAGFKRNIYVVEKSDIIIAFWDGKSPGTKDTINKAKLANKQIIIILY